jgi:hypothetical protein
MDNDRRARWISGEGLRAVRSFETLKNYFNLRFYFRGRGVEFLGSAQRGFSRGVEPLGDSAVDCGGLGWSLAGVAKDQRTLAVALCGIGL